MRQKNLIQTIIALITMLAWMATPAARGAAGTNGMMFIQGLQPPDYLGLTTNGGIMPPVGSAFNSALPGGGPAQRYYWMFTNELQILNSSGDSVRTTWWDEVRTGTTNPWPWLKMMVCWDDTNGVWHTNTSYDYLPTGKNHAEGTLLVGYTNAQDLTNSLVMTVTQPFYTNLVAPKFYSAGEPYTAKCAYQTFSQDLQFPWLGVAPFSMDGLSTSNYCHYLTVTIEKPVHDWWYDTYHLVTAIYHINPTNGATYGGVFFETPPLLDDGYIVWTPWTWVDMQTYGTATSNTLSLPFVDDLNHGMSGVTITLSDPYTKDQARDLARGLLTSISTNVFDSWETEFAGHPDWVQHRRRGWAVTVGTTDYDTTEFEVLHWPSDIGFAYGSGTMSEPFWLPIGTAPDHYTNTVSLASFDEAATFDTAFAAFQLDPQDVFDTAPARDPFNYSYSTGLSWHYDHTINGYTHRPWFIFRDVRQAQLDGKFLLLTGTGPWEWAGLPVLDAAHVYATGARYVDTDTNYNGRLLVQANTAYLTDAYQRNGTNQMVAISNDWGQYQLAVKRCPGNANLNEYNTNLYRYNPYHDYGAHLPTSVKITCVHGLNHGEPRENAPVTICPGDTFRVNVVSQCQWHPSSGSIPSPYIPFSVLARARPHTRDQPVTALSCWDTTGGTITDSMGLCYQKDYTLNASTFEYPNGVAGIAMNFSQANCIHDYAPSPDDTFKGPVNQEQQRNRNQLPDGDADWKNRKAVLYAPSPGLEFVIETSTDLKTWTDYTTVVTDDYCSAGYELDPAPAAIYARARFSRVVTGAAPAGK